MKHSSNRRVDYRRNNICTVMSVLVQIAQLFKLNTPRWCVQGSVWQAFSGCFIESLTQH